MPVTGRTRFIFVSLGSAGDVNPLIWLARLMQARGHEVRFIAQTMMTDHAHRAGLQTVAVGSEEDQRQIVKNPDIWHPRRGFSLLASRFPRWAEEMVPAIRREVAPGRTVLVGATIAFAARIVSELDGIPLVTVHLQPSIFLSFHDAPVLMGGMEGIKKRALWIRKFFYGLSFLQTDRLLKRPVNLVRAKLGLHQPVRDIFKKWASSPDLILALFPEWFAPLQPDWPKQARTTRFPLYDEEDSRPLGSAVSTYLREGPPPVLLTPGSANMHGQDFLAAGVEACHHLGLRAMIATPFKEHLPATLRDHYRQFDFIPFSRVFPHCAAVIHHGGIGTCAQGLAAGVPQLIMAMAHDQPDNAWRLRELNVGDYLYPRKFTANLVSDKLKHLTTSKQVASACKTVQERMQLQMSPQSLVDILEQFAGRMCPSPGTENG
jgi:UDP:flavonoid glycosyltransferase YjiC (YdhE family)